MMGEPSGKDTTIEEEPEEMMDWDYLLRDYEEEEDFPVKLEDRGPLDLIIRIGDVELEECLLDSGANNNFMSESIYRRLKSLLPPLLPVKKMVCFGDDSTKESKGLLKDVVFYIRDCPLKLDFTVLEMEGRGQILLGRQFLVTTKAHLDFEDMKATICLAKEKITLDQQGKELYSEKIVQEENQSRSPSGSPIGDLSRSPSPQREPTPERELSPVKRKGAAYEEYLKITKNQINPLVYWSPTKRGPRRRPRN